MPDPRPTRPLLQALALMVALVAPLAIALDFVLRFGVDFPFWDEWSFVEVLHHRWSGTLRWADVFALHSEHRPFFPRLIMLGLAEVTHYNAVAEMFVGWMCLVGTLAVLFFEHRAAFGRDAKALVSFLPIPWLLCTLRQNENLLWGWQIQVFLCVLCLVAGVVALEQGRQSAWAFGAALAAGVVASFSFAAGLWFWPVALAVLALGRKENPARARRQALGVGIVAAGVALLYFNGYTRPDHHGDYSLALTQPGATAYFAATLLGDPFAGGMASSASAGAAVWGLVVAFFVVGGRGYITPRGTRVAGALVLCALGAVLFILVGRVNHGIHLATASRYTTFGVLLLVGLYRGALDLQSPRLRGLAQGAFAVFTVMAVAASYDGAYAMGASVRAARLRDIALLFEYRKQPDSELQRLLPTPAYLRPAAEFMETNDLGPFHSHR